MLQTLLTRRSCRNFEDRAVEAEKKEKLLQAAQLGPTGKNLRPWEFMVIENKDTLQQLGNCREPSQQLLPRTPLAIVVMGDTQKTDTWIEDTSIASVIMQLEAEKLGLGSCWIQIRARQSNQGMGSEEYVRKLLGIPEHMAVLAILAVGYPAETKPAHTLDEVDQAKIHKETY